MILVLRAPRAGKDLKVLLVSKDPRAFKVLLDLKVHKALPAQLAHRDPRATRATSARKALKEIQVLQAHKATKVQQAPRDHKDFRGL